MSVVLIIIVLINLMYYRM